MIRIATAPVSWGIWEMTIDRPDLIGPETYLETIVDMGYTATETGPARLFRAERRGGGREGAGATASS